MSIAVNEPVFGLAAGTSSDGVTTILAASQRGVIRSIDRGQTWSPVWIDGLAASITTSTDFAIDGMVMAGIDGGVIRSTDGGDTWQFHAFDESHALVGSLSVSRGLVLAGTIDDGLYRSIDRGKTWSSANAGAYISRITAVHSGAGTGCLAGTDGGLFTSNNGGRTWSDRIGGSCDAAVSAVASDGDLTVMGVETGRILAWSARHPIWQCLTQTDSGDEAIALAIGETTGTPGKDIIAVTAKDIREYRVEIGDGGLVVELLATTSLPFPAASAAIVHVDDAPHALIAGFNGEFVLNALPERSG
jgi:hypothetical protein